MGNKKNELTKIVGSSNVFDDPAILENYSKDSSFCSPMIPRLLVKVNNVNEVQKIVKWANKTNTPLIPVSSGPPHYKGDTVASVPEAVIIDLSGMKKIISINCQHRICIVEPGVTYGELQKALAKEGLTLSTSMAPRATKSVITSILEAEPRLNGLSQWEFFDPLRCMEVVWGDGNRMFTGEAAQGPLDLEKQWASQKWQVAGNGPFSTDFFRMLTMSQGTMGIVAWASLKCEILPTIHKMFFVPAQRPEQLNDFVRRVVRLRFSDELMVVNGFYLASLLGENAKEVKQLKAELPAWVALVGILGRKLLPEERLESQQLDIADIAQQFGLRMTPSLPGISGEKVLNKLINPSDEKCWKETAKGAFEDIFFLTTLDKTTMFIHMAHMMAEKAGYPASDIGVYIQPKHRGSCYHLEFNLPYNPDCTKSTQTAKDFFKKASKEFSDMGAYFSRPYGIWSRLQLNKDAQSTMILKDLKGIFDPNNIMNPGKLAV
ncbi:MAG: FAD-binding oxidoreductase [Sedimentisphaerales bacterium]|nr:FAD-binding oxidoreductase [Sedimentisphaerales bacterium]